MDKESNNISFSDHIEENIEYYKTLYDTLLTHFCHQDNHYWNGTQLLIAIQGGTIAAGYSLSDSYLGWISVLLGLILTILLSGLIWKNKKDRDVNNLLMVEIEKKLIKLKHYESKYRVQLTYKSKGWKKIIKGGRLLNYTTMIFITVDILMLIFLFKQWIPIK